MDESYIFIAWNNVCGERRAGMQKHAQPDINKMLLMAYDDDEDNNKENKTRQTKKTEHGVLADGL